MKDIITFVFYRERAFISKLAQKCHFSVILPNQNLRQVNKSNVCG